MNQLSTDRKPVVGIIAEYNPFHNGHAYQIQKARELSGADFCVVAMSGDFVQRGAPAIYDKYTRTKMALASGADLVLELPPFFAVSSAEDFASCGVALLDHLGVVTHLCFGSECGDVTPLWHLAEILSQEPQELSGRIKELLKKGLTYPQARAKALALYLETDGTGSLASFLSSPNNILGTEYCKAIQRRNSHLIPLTVKRQGNNYHDTSLTSASDTQTADDIIFGHNSDIMFSSATAIRESLKHDPLNMRHHVPSHVWDVIQNALPVFPDDFSSLLSYRLLELQRLNVPFDQFLDVSSDLASRIQNTLLDFSSFEEKIGQLKTRQYTYTRISRCLTHILLQMTEEEFAARKKRDYLSYIRILGFNHSGASLLSDIKRGADLPLITKTADASKRLDSNALEEFNHDIFCSHVYQSIRGQKYGQNMRNEFTQSVIIL